MEIAKLSMEVADKRYSGNGTSIRQALSEKANAPAKDLFSTGLHSGLKKASLALEQLIADVSNLTLQHLFESLVSELVDSPISCSLLTNTGNCRSSPGCLIL